MSINDNIFKKRSKSCSVKELVLINEEFVLMNDKIRKLSICNL